MDAPLRGWAAMAKEKMTLGEAIAAERRKRGWNQTQFGDAVGLSQKSVSDIEKGIVGTTEKWRELAAVLGLPEDEVQQMMLAARRVSGKVTRLPRQPRPIRPTPFAEDRGQQVPILGQAVGGDDGRMVFNGSVLGWVSRPHDLAGVPDAYAIYVAGESMEPRYRQGETVWVHPHKPPHVGSDVVVQLLPEEDGEPPSGFIKEYRGRSGDKVTLRQYNPARDIKIDSAKVASIHTVVFAERL